MSAHDEKTSFRLRILTPEREVLDAPVGRLSATGLAGSFEVLPGHEPLLCPLAVGLLAVQGEDEESETLYAVHGGFLEVLGDEATILADVAESGNEVDLERARAARQRAEERLDERTDTGDTVDRDRARAALLRAIARIESVERESFV
jgi:F-type H+-transporting ATPase subunit epsilon